MPPVRGPKGDAPMVGGSGGRTGAVVRKGPHRGTSWLEETMPPTSALLPPLLLCTYSARSDDDDTTHAYATAAEQNNANHANPGYCDRNIIVFTPTH